MAEAAIRNESDGTFSQAAQLASSKGFGQAIVWLIWSILWSLIGAFGVIFGFIGFLILSLSGLIGSFGLAFVWIGRKLGQGSAEMRRHIP